MNIKLLEQALTTEERIDMYTHFKEYGYRPADSWGVWEISPTHIFNGTQIKTKWYKDTLYNDYVQASIFTNINGYKDFVFILIARKTIQQDGTEKVISLHLFTNTPKNRANNETTVKKEYCTSCPVPERKNMLYNLPCNPCARCFRQKILQAYTKSDKGAE